MLPTPFHEVVNCVRGHGAPGFDDGGCRRGARDPADDLAAGSGFTHLCLLPLLPALKQAFPTLTFKLVTVDRADDPELQAADVAIRFGPYIPQEEGVLLAKEAVFPVWSPDYAKAQGLKGTLTTAQLSRLALLHQDIKDPRWLDWAQWFQHAGMGLPTPLRRGEPPWSHSPRG
ncbi:LysR substrate-binding domain-containing protein [Halomonas sp. Mc5H-6]|nr:LysR substrate-binding domain-containing protein [Halomonas sp. Mc5H-6]